MPGAKTQAFNFVPFRMAVAAAICMKEDQVLRMMKTTPSRVAFVEQLVSTASHALTQNSLQAAALLPLDPLPLLP